MEQSDILETTIEIDYSEVLNQILEVLTLISENIEVYHMSLYFLLGIVAGAICGAASVYFFGQWMRGK